MSLTDDWKEKKLDPMWYYVKYKDGRVGMALLIETPNYYGFYNNCDLNNMIAEILASVLTYDELQQFKEFVNLYSHETEITKQLRALLKECRTAFETYAKEDETCGLEEENKYAKHLLTRINAAIGESEE